NRAGRVSSDRRRVHRPCRHGAGGHGHDLEALHGQVPDRRHRFQTPPRRTDRDPVERSPERGRRKEPIETSPQHETRTAMSTSIIEHDGPAASTPDARTTAPNGRPDGPTATLSNA